MKRSTAAFIFLLGMVAGAGALRLAGAFHHHGPPRKNDIVAKLSHDLSLDEAQRAKLTESFTLHDEKMKEFQKETMSKFDGLREENDDRIASILTPEQKTKFEKMREEWRQHHKQEGDRGMPPP